MAADTQQKKLFKKVFFANFSVVFLRQNMKRNNADKKRTKKNNIFIKINKLKLKHREIRVRTQTILK